MGQATINESIWMDVMQAVVSMEDGYTTQEDAKEGVNKAIQAFKTIDEYNKQASELCKEALNCIQGNPNRFWLVCNKLDRPMEREDNQPKKVAKPWKCPSVFSIF